MRRMTLAEFASTKGQTKAAVLLGMAQSALNKAIHSGRDIRVTRQKDGSFTAEEVRPFPSRTKPQAA